MASNGRGWNDPKMDPHRPPRTIPLTTRERRLRTIARIVERAHDPVGPAFADDATIADVRARAIAVGGEWAARARGLR